GTYTAQVILSSPGVGQQSISVSLAVGGSSTGFANAGSMAQLAWGGQPQTGNWKQTFTLVNNGTTAGQVRLNFFTDAGAALPTPLNFPQSPSSATTAATLDRTLNPGQVLVIETNGPQTNPVQTGWVQILTNGNIGASSVYQQNTPVNQFEA